MNKKLYIPATVTVLQDNDIVCSSATIYIEDDTKANENWDVL